MSKPLNTGTLTCDECHQRFDYAPDSPAHVCEKSPAEKKLARIIIELTAIADDLGRRGLVDIADDIRMATKLS